MIFVGAGGGENEGDRGPGGDIAEVKRRVIGVGGMGSGTDVAGGVGLVGPNNCFTGLDGQTAGLKTGRGDSDRLLISRWSRSGRDSGLGIVGGAVGISIFSSEVEIIDSGVDESANKEVNDQPLPQRTFTITSWRIHGLV